MSNDPKIPISPPTLIEPPILAPPPIPFETQPSPPSAFILLPSPPSPEVSSKPSELAPTPQVPSPPSPLQSTLPGGQGTPEEGSEKLSDVLFDIYSELEDLTNKIDPYKMPKTAMHLLMSANSLRVAAQVTKDYEEGLDS